MAIKTTTMIASIPQTILLAFIDGLELRLAEATHPDKAQELAQALAVLRVETNTRSEHDDDR